MTANEYIRTTECYSGDAFRKAMGSGYRYGQRAEDAISAFPGDLAREYSSATSFESSSEDSVSGKECPTVV